MARGANQWFKIVSSSLSYIIHCSSKFKKSLFQKNILLHVAPPFEATYFVHNDIDRNEYNNIDPEYHCKSWKYNSIDWWIWFNKKNLLIIEDTYFTNMNKTKKTILDRHSCNCTHKSISKMLTTQDIFNVPHAPHGFTPHGRCPPLE